MSSNKHRLLNFFLKTTLVIVLGTVLARAESFDDPVPLLERTITISLEQERLEVALKKISTQAGFIFSYNSKIIDRNKIISERFVGKTVREVLDQIFGGSIQYKARGKYVILTKAPSTKLKITGY